MTGRLSKNVNLYEAIAWVAQTPPAFHFGWIDSNRYIAVLSIYALVKGCMASHHGKRAEKAAEGA